LLGHTDQHFAFLVALYSENFCRIKNIKKIIYNCINKKENKFQFRTQVTLSFLASLNLSENNPEDQKMIDRLFRRFVRADAKDWNNTLRRDEMTKQEERDRTNQSEFTLVGR